MDGQKQETLNVVKQIITEHVDEESEKLSSSSEEEPLTYYQIMKLLDSNFELHVNKHRIVQFIKIEFDKKQRSLCADELDLAILKCAEVLSLFDDDLTFHENKDKVIEFIKDELVPSFEDQLNNANLEYIAISSILDNDVSLHENKAKIQEYIGKLYKYKKCVIERFKFFNDQEKAMKADFIAKQAKEAQKAQELEMRNKTYKEQANKFLQRTIEFFSRLNDTERDLHDYFHGTRVGDKFVVSKELVNVYFNSDTGHEYDEEEYLALKNRVYNFILGLEEYLSEWHWTLSPIVRFNLELDQELYQFLLDNSKDGNDYHTDLLIYDKLQLFTLEGTGDLESIKNLYSNFKKPEEVPFNNIYRALLFNEYEELAKYLTFRQITETWFEWNMNKNILKSLIGDKKPADEVEQMQLWLLQ